MWPPRVVVGHRMALAPDTMVASSGPAPWPGGKAADRSRATDADSTDGGREPSVRQHAHRRGVTGAGLQGEQLDGAPGSSKPGTSASPPRGLSAEEIRRTPRMGIWRPTDGQGPVRWTQASTPAGQFMRASQPDAQRLAFTRAACPIRVQWAGCSNEARMDPAPYGGDLAPENESRPNVSNQGFWTRERGQKDWAGSVTRQRRSSTS